MAFTVTDSWKVSKKVVADLLAPLRDVVTVVDAFADVHPALKVQLLADRDNVAALILETRLWQEL